LFSALNQFGTSLTLSRDTKLENLIENCAPKERRVG